LAIGGKPGFSLLSQDTWIEKAVSANPIKQLLTIQPQKSLFATDFANCHRLILLFDDLKWKLTKSIGLVYVPHVA
jgi:hypothetical protein